MPVCERERGVLVREGVCERGVLVRERERGVLVRECVCKRGVLVRERMC